MNRMIIAVIMLFIVIGSAIGESYYVIDVTGQTEYYLHMALTNYHQHHTSQTKDNLQQAKNIWNHHHVVLNSLLIHNYTDDISEKIETSLNTLIYDKNNFPIECRNTLNALQVIRNSMIPYVDNIL